MKRVKRLKNEKGITLVEVLICMIIVAMVVGPLTANFITAAKNKKYAQRIVESTNYAETLMEQIKDRITKDIQIKQKKLQDGLSGLSSDEQERYNKYCSLYIEQLKSKGGGDFGSSMATSLNTAGNNRLANFLAINNADLNTMYDTKNLAYEVVIWPVIKENLAPGATLSDVELSLDSNNLKEIDGGSKPIRLWTDNNYKLSDADYAAAGEPITFKIDKDFITAYVNSDGNTIMCNEDATEYDVINCIKISAKASDNKLEQVSIAGFNALKTKVGGIKEIKNNGDVKGYEITIEDGGGIGSVRPESISILELDMSEFGDTSNPLGKDYVIKVINKTGYNLLVRCPYEHTKEKYHIITENRTASGDLTSAYKTVIESFDTTQPEENYVIGIVIREIDPVTGLPGHIIKKMVQLYSFDPTSERRS